MQESQYKKLLEHMKKIDIYDYYDKMEEQKIMLSFKGDLSNDLITSIVEVVEEKMDKFQSELKTKKKVINVLVECLQNLYHHNLDKADGAETAIMVVQRRNKKVISSKVSRWWFLSERWGRSRYNRHCKKIKIKTRIWICPN